MKLRDQTKFFFRAGNGNPNEVPGGPEYPAPIDIPNPTEIPDPVPQQDPVEIPVPDTQAPPGADPVPEIAPPQEINSNFTPSAGTSSVINVYPTLR